MCLFHMHSVRFVFDRATKRMHQSPSHLLIIPFPNCNRFKLMKLTKRGRNLHGAEMVD